MSRKYIAQFKEGSQRYLVSPDEPDEFTTRKDLAYVFNDIEEVEAWCTRHSNKFIPTPV